jgi:hypothetical protein
VEAVGAVEGQRRLRVLHQGHRGEEEEHDRLSWQTSSCDRVRLSAPPVFRFPEPQPKNLRKRPTMQAIDLALVARYLPSNSVVCAARGVISLRPSRVAAR